MRTRIKLGAAALAFLPLIAFVIVGVLYHFGVLPESAFVSVAQVTAIFNFPAMTLVELLKSFNVGGPVLGISGIAGVLLWTSFIAWFFWRATGTFLGEDEPEGGKFDWIGFQVRFILGFVIGFLLGWRFVKSSTSTGTILTAMVVTGMVGGLIFGLARPASFWQRPL